MKIDVVEAVGKIKRKVGDIVVHRMTASDATYTMDPLNITSVHGEDTIVVDMEEETSSLGEPKSSARKQTPKNTKTKPRKRKIEKNENKEVKKKKEGENEEDDDLSFMFEDIGFSSSTQTKMDDPEDDDLDDFVDKITETNNCWQAQAIPIISKLGQQLARHTGGEESQVQKHLWERLGILLMKGNASLILSRSPDKTLSEVDGVVDS